MATSPQSKQIIDLDPFLGSNTDLRLSAIPTQLGDRNFHVLISQIFAGLVKADIGLARVDNTSDEEKPLSEAARTAFNSKAAFTHNHPMSSVVGLENALGGYVHKDDQAFMQAKFMELMPSGMVRELSSDW